MVLRDLRINPVPIFLLFLFTMIVPISSMHPLLIGINLFCGLFSDVIFSGKKALKTDLPLILVSALFITLINGFFTHNGVTVLFYIKGLRITQEALMYGLFLSLLISGLVIWGRVYVTLLDPEKWRYLLSKLSPKLSMLLSLIFRTLSLTPGRFKALRQGRAALGKEDKPMESLRTLLSYTLESGIESADNMMARGFLKGKATSFSPYGFSFKDGLLCLAVAGAFIILVFFSGEALKTYYYPRFTYVLETTSLLLLCLYFIILLIPATLKTIFELRWMHLTSRI